MFSESYLKAAVKWRKFENGERALYPFHKKKTLLCALIRFMMYAEWVRFGFLNISIFRSRPKL